MPKSAKPVATATTAHVTNTPELAAWVREALEGLPAIVTIAEAARVLRMSGRNVRRLIAVGRIQSLKVCTGPGAGRVLFARSEVARFLESLAVAA